MNVTHTHAGAGWRGRGAVAEPGVALSTRAKGYVATTIGLAGALALAVPLVLWDWASSGHSASELPMAATAWLFGLGHFTQNGYDWSSIVVGVLLVAAYGILNGLVFGGLADRFLGLATMPEAIGAGLAWGFVSWLFFWYTLLPMVNDGGPFQGGGSVTTWGMPTITLTLFVAPIWVFVLGFALLGIATSVTYLALVRR